MTDQHLLPQAYQGLTGTQALAQAFFNRTTEAMDHEMPNADLVAYTQRFTQAQTFQEKQLVLRDITTHVLRLRK